MPRLVDGFYVWEKGLRAKITKHFSTQEFQCHCSFATCREQAVSAELVQKLEEIRVEVGVPITVTSGYRCIRHQANLREAGLQTVALGKRSTHERGEAADVACTDMQRLTEEAGKRFEAIGTAKTFLHLDTRKGKQRRWSYT